MAKMQRHRRLQVFKLLAESVRQVGASSMVIVTS
jgi:hypothetical protein